MKLTDIQYETLKVMVESRAKIDEDKGITIKLEDIIYRPNNSFFRFDCR